MARLLSFSNGGDSQEFHPPFPSSSTTTHPPSDPKPRQRAKMLVLRSTRAYLRSSILLLQPSSAFSSYSSSAAAVEAERTIRDGPRNDWTRPDIKSIYDSPLLDLLFHGVCLFSLSSSVFLMDLNLILVFFFLFAFKFVFG